MSDAKDRAHPAQTTIVDGPPPGNAWEAPPIPVALEELLGMAAATPAFAEALLADPRAAAEAAALALTATEEAILGAVDRDQLALMIAEVREQLPEPDRRAFLEQSALAIAVLLGGGMAVTGAGCKSEKTSRSAGSPRQGAMGTSPTDPDPAAGMQAAPPPPPPPALPPGPDASTPVMQREPPMHHEPYEPTKGIRPDRIRPKAPDPGKTTGSRPNPRTKPMRPPRTLKSAGVRPPRPPNQPPTFGMRPPDSYPEPPKPPKPPKP